MVTSLLIVTFVVGAGCRSEQQPKPRSFSAIAAAQYPRAPFLLSRPERLVPLRNEAAPVVKSPSARVQDGAPNLARVYRRLVWEDPNRRIGPDVRWDGVVSQGLYNASVLMTLNPSGRFARSGGAEGERFADVVDRATKKVSVPTGRKGESLLPARESRQSWGRILEASIALWHYAMAYDLLRSPDVARQLPEGALDRLYTKVADGGLKVLVDHLSTLPDIDPTQTNASANNWIARELAGVGAACLAFGHRLQNEPAGSARRRSYDAGLALFRSKSSRFLQAWSSQGEPNTYYYEGPHYFAYWAMYFLPVAAAHAQVFPDDTPQELSLGRNGLLARMARGYAMTLAPVLKDDTGRAIWATMPLDDSFIDPDLASDMLACAQAFIPEESELFRYLSMLVGPRVNEYALVPQPETSSPPSPPPPVQVSQQDGLAVLRSGWRSDDLVMTLKNTPELFVLERGKPPRLNFHSHAHFDALGVSAYRSGEPVILDPGYGPRGYATPDRQTAYLSWERHSVPLIRESGWQAAYASQLGIDPDYRPATFPFSAAVGARITAYGLLSAGNQRMPYAAATANGVQRIVLVGSRQWAVVIDRPDAPRQLRLQWWGNGAKSPAEGDPKRVTSLVGGTAGDTVVATRDTATFSRGRVRSRFEVVSSVPVSGRLHQGKYGPRWGGPEPPIAGFSTSLDKPARYVVTVIRLQGPGEEQAPEVKVKASLNQNGVLVTIGLTVNITSFSVAIQANGGLTLKS